MNILPIYVKKAYEDVKLPVRAFPTDSGLDVFAYSFKMLPNGEMFGESIPVPPGGRVLVDTGIIATVKAGYEIQVRPRSGLASKYGITVLNTPGTVDYGYRGIICVTIINHSKDFFTIKKGDKIAQLVVCPIILSDVIEVKELPETDRGVGGFGSTGN